MISLLARRLERLSANATVLAYLGNRRAHLRLGYPVAVERRRHRALLGDLGLRQPVHVTGGLRKTAVGHWAEQAPQVVLPAQRGRHENAVSSTPYALRQPIGCQRDRIRLSCRAGQHRTHRREVAVLAVTFADHRRIDEHQVADADSDAEVGDFDAHHVEQCLQSGLAGAVEGLRRWAGYRRG